MAVEAKVLADGQLSDTLATIFTATTTTYITFFTFFNTDAAVQQVQFYLDTSSSRKMWDIANLGEYEHIDGVGRLVLEVGDEIGAFSTDASVVNYWIMGGEES
jgi:hypothetical protein